MIFNKSYVNILVKVLKGKFTIFVHNCNINHLQNFSITYTSYGDGFRGGNTKKCKGALFICVLPVVSNDFLTIN